MKDILAKVQRHKRLARILPVRVHAESNRRGTPQRAAKANHAQKYRRHNPQVPLLGGPAVAHEADERGEEDRDRHHETEFGLVEPTVAPRHGFDDDIGHLTGDGGSQHAADKGRDVHQARLQGVEVVVVLAIYDGHGLGDDNEPADRAGVDGGGPEDGGVGEEDEGADGDFEPVVLVETAMPRAELLYKGFGFAFAPVTRVGAELGESLLSLGFGLLFVPRETQTAVGGGAAGSWPGGQVVVGGGCQRRCRRRCCGSSMFCEIEGRWSGIVVNRRVVDFVHAIVRLLRRLIRMLRSRSSIKLNMVFFSSKANFMCSRL